jgi:hypothetical protein
MVAPARQTTQVSPDPPLIVLPERHRDVVVGGAAHAGAPGTSDPARPVVGERAVGVVRYSTASDGSKLVQALRSDTVSRNGRRRTPTGYCHAVPWWAPARALCGRLTEPMVSWPQADFMAQRVQVCPQCRATVRAELEGPPVPRA